MDSKTSREREKKRKKKRRTTKIKPRDLNFWFYLNMARYGRWGPVRGRVRIRKSVSGLGLALVRIRLSGDPHCPALALIGQNQPARGWFWAGDWLAGRCENELIPKLVFFFIIILFFFLHFDIIIFILQRKSTREVYAVQNRALNMRDKPG